MTTLEQFVSPALTRALGWTLLHSLWQGALVAAVLAGVLLLLRRQRAEVRYVAAAGALGVIVALAGLTFGLYFRAGAEAGALLRVGRAPATWAAPLPAAERGWGDSRAAAGAVVVGAAHGAIEAENQPRSVGPAARFGRPAGVAEASAIPSFLPSLIRSLQYFDRHLPLLVVAWLLGLLAMSLRMLGGLLYVQRLRRYRVRPLGAAWQARLAGLAARAGLRRPVALLESALVRVPLVVGHMRPVILLPLGAVAGLPPAYLEAILAHELAHVLRRDYLVNLLQTVAEVLFFYHPAVWFVANCVRTERENCCDDTATALVGGDPLRLALALTALAEWSQAAVAPAAPHLALAALGRPGALLSRVRRLVQRRPAAPTLAEGLLAGALVLGGLGLLGGSMALAGPLARPALGQVAAFDWQAGPTPGAASPADTSKRAKGAAVVPPVPVLPPAVAETVPAPPPAPAAADDEAGIRQEILVGQEGPGSADGPGAVVITKDKKGRLTGLTVNGQPVEAATAKPSKAERRAGRQVTVVPLPAANSRRGRWDDRLDEQARELDRQARELDEQAREMDQQARETDRKVSRKLDKAADKVNKAAASVGRGAAGGRRGPHNEIHLDIDDAAFGRLVNNAVALGSASLELGLEAAAQGLEEARRDIERELRAPGLNAQTRSAKQEIVRELRREQERVSRGGRSEASELPARTDAEAQAARDRIQENQDRVQEAKDRAQEQRDRAQEKRDRQQELQERIRESQQELRELDRGAADRARDGHEALVAQMLKDGLIKDKDHFQLTLTARRLVVDGKEQSAAVLQKYRQLHERSSGRPLSATGSVVVTRNSDTSSINSNTDADVGSRFGAADGPAMPRPPRAPRVPRAPGAPGGMVAPPALPAPPLPPRVDSGELRDELRKDGVLGRDEKSFQFQLNNAGLTVNGQRQPEKLAAKYRKLTGHEGDKKFTVTISAQD